MSHFTLSPVASQIIEAINESSNIAETILSLDKSDLTEKAEIMISPICAFTTRCIQCL